MPTTTAVMALQNPVDSDNSEVALTAYILANNNKIDVHTHQGGVLGTVIPAGGVALSAGQATGAALGADVATLTGAQNLTNKTVNGYGIMTNPTVANTLLQSGTATSLGGSTQGVNFPVAFGSGTPVVVLTLNLGGSLHAYVCQVELVNISGFDFSVLDESSARVVQLVSWIAIGARV